MNIKHTLKYAEEPNLDSLFVAKKANEWIIQSRALPMPKMLFGELWREGELAVLAAGSGAGKSLLAVQIAESIARGKAAIENGKWKIDNSGNSQFSVLNSQFAKQKVLYLDLKLSQKQFEMRYAEEHNAERGEFLRKHHKFPSNLIRVEVVPNGKLPEGFRSFDEVLPRLVERLADKTGAKVVIIDSITQLQRSVYGYRETHAVMKALDALKRRLGISILVLARTTRHDAFGRFADSVFTIGHSKLDTACRYIKQITTRSSERLFDESHVASFVIKRLNGNFLGFEHRGFGPESEHLRDVQSRRDWPLIDKIKQMSDGGMSVRKIAAELELPKTSVHRYLQMWQPEDKETAVAKEPKPFDPTTSPNYFPGREEYDEAGRHPRFKCLYDDDSEENRRLRREAYLIESACAKAYQEYKKTGKAPTLAEMLERLSVPPAVAGGLTLAATEVNGTEPSTRNIIRKDESSNDQLQPPATAGGSDSHTFQPQHSELLKGAKHSFDHNDLAIFVEKEDDNGKPTVWYRYDSKGRLYRWQRRGYGSMSTQIDGPPCVI